MKHESYPRLTLDHNYHVDYCFFDSRHRIEMLEANLPLKTLDVLDTSEYRRGGLTKQPCPGRSAFDFSDCMS